MNDFERQIRELISQWSAKISDWWSHSSIKSALANRSVDTAELRRQASAQAQRAADAAKNMRDSDTAKKAASAMKDLRDSDTAKKAGAALADLRQREPVRKAEESATRLLHDLRSGHNGGGDKS